MLSSLRKVQTTTKGNYELSSLETNVESEHKPQFQSMKIHSILEIDTSFEGYNEINNSLDIILDWDMTYLDPDFIPNFEPYDGANVEVPTYPAAYKQNSCLSLKSTTTDEVNFYNSSSQTPNYDELVTVKDPNFDFTIPLPIALKQLKWRLVFLLLARIRIYYDEQNYRKSLREAFFFACLPESSRLALLFLHIPLLDITEPFQSDFLFHQYLVPFLSVNVSNTQPIPNELPYKHICCITGQHHILKLILELKLGRPEDLDSNLHTPLHMACLVSSLKCAQVLIDNGANVNAHSRLHYIPTPLYCAVLSNLSSQLISLLLQKSAKLESAQSSCGTTLHLAAALGNVKIAEILIKEGSDINSQFHVDWKSITTLNKHKRLQGKCSMSRACLLSNKLSLNQLDKRLSTPLMIACGLGNVQIVELLLHNNADVHLQDCHQDTAIFYAAGEWYNGIVDRLIGSGADVNSKNHLNDTPVLQALKADHHKPSAKSCKISNCINKLIDTIETLVRNNADLNYENTQGDSFISLFLRHWPTCNKLLELAAKFDLNFDTPDRDEKTLLLHACEQGWIYLVRVLLAKDANFEVTDRKGNTPLLVACQNGHKDLIELLLQVEADPFQENLDGVTPLLIIVKRGEVNLLDLIISPGYMSCEPLRNLTFASVQPLPWVVAGKAGDDRVLSKLIKHLLWEDNIPFKEMFRQGLRESIHYWLLHPIYFVSCNPRENTEMQRKYTENKSLYHLIAENNRLDLGTHPVVHAYVHSVFKFFATKYLWMRIFLSILFLFALGFSFVYEATSRNRASYQVECLPAEIFMFLYWLTNVIAELLQFSNLLASGKKPNSYYWKKPFYMFGFIEEDDYNIVEAYKVHPKTLKGRFKKLMNRRHFILCAFWNYFKDGYNWIEFVANTSLLIYFCTRIFLIVNPSYHFADYFYYLRLIAFLFNCSCFIKFIIIFSLFGEYLHILFVMFKDEVPKFLVLFSITVFIFSVTFFLALRLPIHIDSNSTGNGTNAKDITINLFDLTELDGITNNFGYLLLFCLRILIEGDQVDFAFYYDKFNFVAVILTFGFLFITLVVYINLFVAQLLDTYQSVKNNARSIVAKNRMCFVDNNQCRSIFSKWFRPQNDYLILKGDTIVKYFNLESAFEVQQIMFPYEKQEINEVLEASLTQLRTEMRVTSHSQKPAGELNPQIEQLNHRLLLLTEQLDRFAGVEKKIGSPDEQAVYLT